MTRKSAISIANTSPGGVRAGKPGPRGRPEAPDTTTGTSPKGLEPSAETGLNRARDRAERLNVPRGLGGRLEVIRGQGSPGLDATGRGALPPKRHLGYTDGGRDSSLRRNPGQFGTTRVANPGVFAMPLLATTIGAYPKPEYVRIPDWFSDPKGTDSTDPTRGWAEAMAKLREDRESILARGVSEAVSDQVGAGIDIPTDGEIPRENYIHYHCRHLEGVSFNRLEEKALRNEGFRAMLPSIVAPLRAGAPFLPIDYRRAQACTDREIKITIPGPMTIADTTVDRHYDDPRALGRDLAAALNAEVLSLARAGCRHIQIDEPLFARKPDAALDYGFDHLERAFHGCPEHVTRTVHMCCGYPDLLDRLDYPKADPGSYFRLAGAIENSTIDAVSIEDAHRPNDLTLLECFRRTTVILGVVAIARSRVESVAEIGERLAAALQHIDAHRLIAAPDCGLGLLGRALALRKLKNLCRAARGAGGDAASGVCTA